MFNQEEFREVDKKVKFITGATASEVERKAKEFEKTHNVIDIKQENSLMMILLYLE